MLQFWRRWIKAKVNEIGILMIKKIKCLQRVRKQLRNPTAAYEYRIFAMYLVNYARAIYYGYMWDFMRMNAVFSSYSFWFLYDRTALRDRRRDSLSPNASWWRLSRDVILPYFRQSARASCTHSFGDHVFRIHVCGHAPVVRYGPCFLPQRLVYFISADQAGRYTRLTQLYIQQKRRRKLIVHDFMRVILMLWANKNHLSLRREIYVEYAVA